MLIFFDSAQFTNDRWWLFLLDLTSLANFFKPIFQIMSDLPAILQIVENGSVYLLQVQGRINFPDLFGTSFPINVFVKNRFNPYPGSLNTNIILRKKIKVIFHFHKIFPNNSRLFQYNLNFRECQSGIPGVFRSSE